MPRDVSRRLALAALAAISATVLGQVAGPVPGRAGVSAPGTYSWWSWPGTGYSSFEWDLTPETDPSPEGIFWSHQFWFANSDVDGSPTAGYFGLQTEGSVPTGKIAILSIWNTLSATGPAGGYAACPTNTGEGNFCTVRIPYVWVPRHTYSLSVASAATSDCSSGGACWSASVQDLSSSNPTDGGANQVVGYIGVPEAWGALSGSNKSVVWTELYSGLSSCSALVTADARFTNVTADGGTVTASSASNTVNQGGCLGTASVNSISGGVDQMLQGTTSTPTATPVPTPIPISVPTSGRTLAPTPTPSPTATPTSRPGSPTPTATATVRPAARPTSGGKPQNAAAPTLLLLLLIALAVVASAALLTVSLLQRRRSANARRHAPRAPPPPSPPPPPSAGLDPGSPGR
jgi:hypothetical protein